MQRVLTFDPADPRSAKRFAMCRTALLQAGDMKGPRDRETIRKEARLFQALDGISEAPNALDPDARVLLATAGPITLSGEDHALLAKYLDTTPWLPRAAADAVDVQDWADSAAKVD